MPIQWTKDYALDLRKPDGEFYPVEVIAKCIKSYSKNASNDVCKGVSILLTDRGRDIAYIAESCLVRGADYMWLEDHPDVTLITPRHILGSEADTLTYGRAKVQNHPVLMPTFTLAETSPEAAQSDLNAGRKYDTGKQRYDLIPPLAESEMVDVLTFGATKYGAENWRKLDDLKPRYIAAALRHIAAYRKGQTHDEESGKHHLAHALCCLAFITQTDLEREA